MKKSIQSQYFQANIKEQAKAWSLMFEDAKKQGMSTRQANMYVRCYHFINSGNAKIQIDDLYPADVDSILREYDRLLDETFTQDELDVAGHSVYIDLHPDSELSLKDYQENR